MKCKQEKENSSCILFKCSRREGEGSAHMIKTLQMFEFGSLQEAMSRGGEAPTTTKFARFERIRKMILKSL